MSFRWTIKIMSFLLIGSCLIGEAAAENKPSYTRTIENYQIPDVTLINQDGARIQLRKLLASDGPVLVDFVFTTCTTICPVLSSNFMNFQNTIIAESGKARLVSISVDPDFDTPKEMKAYLKRYQAKPGWDFLTGSRADIDRVLRAFNVFTRDKMDHPPVILLKSPTDSRWVRIYGLIGTNKLLVEYEKVRQ
jgi:protein SCO1/2